MVQPGALSMYVWYAVASAGQVVVTLLLVPVTIGQRGPASPALRDPDVLVYWFGQSVPGIALDTLVSLLAAV